MVPHWQTSEWAEGQKANAQEEVRRLWSLTRADAQMGLSDCTLQDLQQWYMAAFEPGACALVFGENPPENAHGITRLARDMQVAAYALSREFGVTTEEVLAWMKALYQTAFRERVKASAN